MSTLNPTEVDVLKWLAVVRHPESNEAASMAASLVITAHRQAEEANRILAAEVVALRERDRQNAALLKRCHDFLAEILPGAKPQTSAPASPPRLTIVARGMTQEELDQFPNKPRPGGAA